MDGTLRINLETLRDRTQAGATVPNPAFWVGDTANERRVQDDLAAGRLSLRSAHQSAVTGLRALDDGDLEMALMCLCNGYNLLVGALAGRIRPADRSLFLKPAKKRGRPRNN